MTDPFRPIRDALASLGLRLGEPLTVDGRELVPASCRTCRQPAWHWPGGVVADGSAMLMDLEYDSGQSYLNLHGCHYDEIEDDPFAGDGP